MIHLVHSVVVAVGTVLVLALVVPADVRRTRRLRRDLRAGDLLTRAQERARAQLATPGPGVLPAATPAARPSPGPWTLAAATASVVAAVVHAIVCPGHFTEGLRFGVFFLLLGLTQFALAAALVRRPSRAVVLASAALSLGVVALWLLTRTVGLPFALAAVEPFGFLDVVASAAELAVVGCALGALRELPVPDPRVPAASGIGDRRGPRAARMGA